MPGRQTPGRQKEKALAEYKPGRIDPLRLSDNARPIFERNYAMLYECGVVIDVNLLAAYANAIAQYEKAQQHLEQHGMTVKVGKTSYEMPSPYLGIRDRSMEMIERLGERLQLDKLVLMPKVRDPSLVDADLSAADVHRALSAAGGVLTHAANILGTDRKTLRAYIDAHPDLVAIEHEVDEANKDIAESQLMQLIRGGDRTAVIYFLETQAADRGFQRNTKVTHKDEREVVFDLSGATEAEIHEIQQWLASGGHGPPPASLTRTRSRAGAGAPASRAIEGEVRP